MNVLITGAAGFIGSHLVEECVKLGWNVVGIDHCRHGRADVNLDHLNKTLTKIDRRFSFIEGDILNRVKLDTAAEIFDFKIDCVLHQAALGSVPRSLKEPALYEQNNIMGMSAILNFCKDLKIPKLVFASSSSVYGAGRTEALKKVGEESQVASPYAMTKKINEYQAQTYARMFGIEYIGLRYFNVFGPRQNPYGDNAPVIARWIDQIRKKERVQIYGSPLTSRDFTHVDNVVLANLLAVKSQNPKAWNRVYNVGAGHSVSLIEAFNTISKIFKDKGVEVYEPHATEPRRGDVLSSQADLQFTEALLGYEVITNFKEGVEKLCALES